MTELIKKLNSMVIKICAALLCHRMIYAGLTACHGTASILSDKPALYAAMAVLYAILAIRG